MVQLWAILPNLNDLDVVPGVIRLALDLLQKLSVCVLIILD
jgi:hypothetical protein